MAKTDPTARSLSIRSLSSQILGALIVLALVLSAVNAAAWWDGKWQYRKKIQLDATAKGADIKENLMDVPVLVRLHLGNFSFSSAKADGSDIRFLSADDKSPLKYHIEKFDPKEEIALIWVKVPRITGGSGQDSVWMYYGNPSAPDGQDPGGTYDVSQIAVYHLHEKDGAPRDSTSFGNHSLSITGKLGLPAIIGGGAQFGGAGQVMKIGDSPSLNFTKGFTFSAWVRLNQPVKDAPLLSWDDGSQSILVGVDETKVFCSLRQGSGTVATPRTAALTPKRWQHLAVTIDPNNRITIYIDGSEMVSARMTGTVPAPASMDMIIGGSSKGGNSFVGDIDEIQLSSIARVSGWIRAAFRGQGSDSQLATVLEEESGGGSSEALTIQLLKVIVRTITLDGWIIIGILAIMGCASTAVFVQKVKIIRLTNKGNTRFSENFRTAADPLSLAESDQDIRDSSLYRVYSAGLDELKSRMDRQGTAAKEAITGRAMTAFKAALERASMNESRRYSAGMIILNMSVAGGPFLGLLGTVWGVMNTFASLAEAGEANLTAIAPGVASALACTLAGLLVAIPALFASSYLTGLIKDLSADNNVFIDELIIRLEEEKGEAA